MSAPVFVAAPDGPVRGGVVVIQEAFGVTSHIQDVCRRFAAAGWYAAAPHLFHRFGDPVISYDDIDAAMKALGGVRAEEISADVDDALAVLGQQGLDPAHCAIVGYCMGGAVSLVTATTHHLGAAVTYYGGGIRQGRFGFPPTADLAPSLKTPWLGLFGDDDTGIPLDDVEYLREQAVKSAVRTDVIHYPDAGHGFNCDDRSAYAPVAAKEAWAKTLAWFEEFVPSP